MQGKVAFHTLGCKLNYAETSTIGKQFIQHGFGIVEDTQVADVYLINTCTVTENADKECRQIVRRLLKKNPEAYVIVTGCYAQLRPNEIVTIEGVDAVLGSNEKFEIFDLIKNFEKRNLSCIHVSEHENLNSFHSSYSSDSDDRTRAFFKIQDGCDYKCSFCTIPLARGKSRSNNPQQIVDQFRQILDSGYKEVILTGVNVGDYGKTFDIDFYGLLQLLLKVQGDYRLRISSIEPNLLNDNIIALTKEDDRICNHFHIPLQSGSDEILKLMQRRYNTFDYRKVIEKATEKIPNLGIGVDVIVGFPGETRDHFLETYNFLESLPISYLHVFTYSERPNTKAIAFEGKVDVVERKRRTNLLRVLSEQKKSEFYNKMIGKELKVLFEHENNDGLIKGFTSNYIRVQHPFQEGLTNKLMKVKIREVNENICTAEELNNESTKQNVAS